MIQSNKLLDSFFSFKNIIGFIVSAICIYWSFFKFESGIFYKHISSIDYYLFVLASFLLILSVLIRSLRWILFFKDEESENLTLYQLFENQMIGYFANNILPLRLGDLLRVSKMSKVTGLSQSYLLGTIISERIIDIISLFLLSLIFLVFFYNDIEISSLTSQLNFITLFNAQIFIYIFILFLLLLLGYFIIKNTNWFNFKLFISAFLNVKGYVRILKILFFSFLIWGIYLLNIMVISQSVIGIESFSMIDSMLLLIFVTISIVLLPSGPGTIGTFQAAVIFIMTSDFFGYIDSEAVSFSIILHAYSYIAYSIVGGYFFLKSNFQLNQ